MLRVLAPIPATSTFSFDGTKLLYANFPRMSVRDLRYLLARGSGYVVKGRCMPKSWFQAQCAHYGLPTSGTLAALRSQLDLFLSSPFPRVPKGLVILEKRSRDKHALATAPSLLQEELPMDRSREGDDQIRTDKTHIRPTPAATTPRKPSLPRAKIFALARFKKSVRWDPVLAEDALQEIKLRMGRPEPTSGTDSEGDDEEEPARSSQFAAWPTRNPATRWPPRSLVPFTADGVSGRWELRVTCHTISPLPAPWHTTSSKWLKGDMNVQLAGDGQSLTGEFALLGLDGKFKSRRCDLRADGISAWVRFVAQMPIATVKPLRYQGHQEHSLTFGPSWSQYGYLRFYGGNQVGGMLRCRKYGKLEFTGIRVGGPVDMASDWRSFVEQ